ncbi:MAG: hypothetical protein KF799_05700 [Bdellovibrionales bacterium]|nr:hypothetical protein [Bdellovibrionales bacterium]
MGTLALVSTGCTGLFSGKMFKERAAETPAPNDDNVDKSFFVDPSGKPKTFMCAWAPEVARGEFGEELLTPLMNSAPHCNVEFEITEDFLIAKMINPSYPDDRGRWKEWLKIPITKHFYYEREKDSHGRETNRWIENDGRSHWSARPKMRLNLSAMHILDMGVPGWGSFQISSVSEREWDKARGFFAFSFEGVFSNPSWGIYSEYQAKFRVNFMEFQHDPTFKKVPYHQENSRLMNILHVMGRKVEGVQQELYAAHWDLRKTQNLYLNGVPQELESTVVSAVYRWNTALQDAGVVPRGHVAFAPIIKNLDHPFDLRYPSVNWISDKRISMNAPLGIGLASADVRNGKILWGSVLMFGGVLEHYINAYTPVESGGADGSSRMQNGAPGVSPFSALAALLPSSLRPMKDLDQLNPALRDQLVRNLRVDHTNHLNSEIARLAQLRGAKDQTELARLKMQLEDFKSQDPQLNKIVADLLSSSKEELFKSNDYFHKHKLQDMFGSSAINKGALSASEAAEAKGDKNLAAMLKEANPQRRGDLLKALRPQTSPFFAETEYTLENMAGSWMNSPARKTRTYPEMLKSVVMHLALHELGHFLGLGHQFKENIVPEEGSVPSRYVKELSRLSTEKNEFTNSTSIMGYRSGRTEMVVPANEITTGAHDHLVLRYLYKGQYASYDKTADDFVFTDVPSNGKIPEHSFVKTKSGQSANLPTSYFPQCNDYEASLGADPFCNRWDRGSKAEDIVKSYFEFISDNLLANLYSLVGGGANPQGAEGRLWYTALNGFSRTRMFYDEMRRQLRSEPHLKPLWNQLRNDKNALFEFSTACQKENPTDPNQVQSATLRRIFADRGIVDLCRANLVTLNEMRFFLNLPDADYAKIDHKNRYISGGYLEGDATRNWGHIFGSWYQMSNLPLKFTSLFTLSGSTPYLMWGPYLMPNPYYDNEENKYLYRTLYPREYTKLVADTVQHNMRFAANGTDDTTTMGRAILATGGLLPWQRYQSNDAARLPREFNDLLDQQSEFQYSMVAVIITATPPDAGSKVEADHYKKFTAKIYDFFTGQNITARDVFILPKGQVFVWANGMFLYPVTKMKFFNDTAGYVIAYKVSYDYEEGDVLIEDSVKSALMEKHNEIAANCVNGFEGRGLLNYFDTSNAEFKGFKIPPGIANEIGKEKIGLFYDSIEKQFQNYETWANAKIPAHFPIKSMRTICDESIRGVGQISASAGLMNGYWLGITADYVEK